MTNAASRQLILNEDTPLYQLMTLIGLLIALIGIVIKIDLPWNLFAISGWVLVSFGYVEFTRKSYSLYLENGQVIVYNLFNMKGKRFAFQAFDKVTFSQGRVQAPGVYRFLVHFKDGTKFNFCIGSGTIQLNGPMGIFNSEAAILSHVNGLIQSFIAGNQNVPARPFASRSWR